MAMLTSSSDIGNGTLTVIRDSLAEKKEDAYDYDEVEASPRLFQKVVAELVGTFILMFIGCGSAFVAERGNTTLIGVAVAWSLAAVAMIYTVGHVSGAHFNPAVTVAFAVVGKFAWREVPYYVVSHIVSASVACEVLQLLFEEDKAAVMLTLPGASFNDLNVIAWEIIASFILMWVVSGAAADDRAAKEQAGIAIGAAIFVDALVAGKVTGASMNPARSLGPAIATRNFEKIWIYLVAPVIGTVAAAAVYSLLQLPGEPRPKNATKRVRSGVTRRLNPAFSEKSMDLP